MPYTELVPPPAYEDMSSRSNINSSRRQNSEDQSLMDPLLLPSLSSSAPSAAPQSSNNGLMNQHVDRQDPSGRSTSRAPGTTTTTTRRRQQHNHQSHHRSHHQQGRILDRDADFYQSRGRWNGVELMPRQSGRRNRSSLSVGYHYQNQRRGGNKICGCINSIAIKRKLRQWLPVLWDDWFHTLAYQRTLVLMLILFLTYSGIVFGYGFIYLAVSILGAEKTRQADGSYVTTSFCDMDINDHMEALYFSLSTMTTIGYGVSDYYFGGCWTPLLLVLSQACTAITFDAVAVGLLFTRLSRGRKRSKTIVVSNQAVVQVVQGIPYFMFRVGELRRFPLMDASVRVFCIRHERIPRVYPSPTSNSAAFTAGSRPAAPNRNNNNQKLSNKDTTSVATARTVTTTESSSNTPNRVIPVETTHFVTRAMKLLHPDETLMHSNHILMSLPQVIVHRMDDKSPLMPPSEWYDSRGHQHAFPLNKENRIDVQNQIQEFWRDRGIEIVVLVEGIDELTGTSVQTRHSYCTSFYNYRRNNYNNNNSTSSLRHHRRNDSSVPDHAYDDVNEEEEEGDVVWNRAFVNCVFPFSQTLGGEGEGGEDEDEGDDDVEGQASYYPHLNRVCAVDFGRFHDTVPTPRDCLASPYVPY